MKKLIPDDLSDIIIEEIPNLIQIATLVSVISFFGKDIGLKILVATVIVLLFAVYLDRKYRKRHGKGTVHLLVPVAFISFIVSIVILSSSGYQIFN